ncbi:MAG TPA: ankyrin repeat domain-containing protein [Candidatus Rifleibacterium sp.]|nr:ankyrin repeat domain-containing protein [Candidatus Rifleibacterium sp.]HPT46584.1 ankyrin repeat domain-containing protein [Candidatus Rifleibacterium sp.]
MINVSFVELIASDKPQDIQKAILHIINFTEEVSDEELPLIFSLIQPHSQSEHHILKCLACAALKKLTEKRNRIDENKTNEREHSEPIQTEALDSQHYLISRHPKIQNTQNSSSFREMSVTADKHEKSSKSKIFTFIAGIVILISASVLAFVILSKDQSNIHGNYPVAISIQRGEKNIPRAGVEMQTKRFRVRIESFDEAKFRYTSWPIERPITEKPSLILTGGKKLDDGFYLFQNGEYSYRCYFKGSAERLEVYKCNNLILKEPVERIRALTAEEISSTDFEQKQGKGANPELLISLFKQKSNQPSLEHVVDAIKNGADVNATDKEHGETVLSLAVTYNSNLEIINALIVAGADVNARNDAGMTPLIWAASFNDNPAIVKALIRAGSELEALDNYQRTALISAAASNQNLDIITTLINEGANVNAQRETGETALSEAAAYNNNPEIISILLREGVNPSTKNIYGFSALDRILGNKALSNSTARQELEAVTR